MGKTFAGGVHPPENKRYSESRSIEILDAPEVAYIPLSQHIGAPAEPAVNKGDKVLVGQTIGSPKGFVSVPVHASIAGKVLKIDLHPHSVTGKPEPHVIIENDGSDERAQELETLGDNWENIEPKKIVEIARAAGLAGMGGATFPTHVKLSPPEGKIIDTVFLNGAECEPYLTADHRLMLEFADDIIDGFILIGKALGAKRHIICIEANKPDAIEVMIEKTRGTGIEVCPLKVKYPQGAEKQMIKAVTGREVPSGGLPFDCGCYVQNVGTAKALFDAVSRGIPLYRRVVTVSGPIVKNPSNLMARIGTPFSALVEACGGTTEPVGKIISGGPMMGLAQHTDEVAVIKGTSGIVLFGLDDAESPNEMPCINCAKCVDACPAYLMPTNIAACGEYGNIEMAEKLGALDCIECGSCAYVCPSNRRLLHYIRAVKNEINIKKARERAEKAKAESEKETVKEVEKAE
ncbi:electron transport complex subunit RsxC [bacterium]|mgnify:CR=1 FL=1|nr:MAG: electron transport complex subunit RsxC [bacterium]